MTATAARTFVRDYANAFSAFAADPDETALRGAYELGREALLSELSLLDLATAHHEALVAATRQAGGEDLERVTRLAAEFLAESLSAYEMARRGFGEVANAAAAERRQAALVRSLSSLLTDASLALHEPESIEEMVRLVAEHACELCNAACCVITIHGTRPLRPISIEVRAGDDGDEPVPQAAHDLSAGQGLIRAAGGVARLPADDARTDRALGPHRPDAAPGAWLGVLLSALDGTELGFIQLLRESDDAFSELDVALVVQLGEMTSAALERATHYARSHGKAAGP